MRLWNLRTAGNNIALGGHTAAVCAVAISPDARAIFSGGRDKALVFWGVDESEEGGGPWEVTQGYSRMQQMRRLVKKPLPGSAVTSLSVASNHLYVAIGYADGVLEQRNTNNIRRGEGNDGRSNQTRTLDDERMTP